MEIEKSSRRNANGVKDSSDQYRTIRGAHYVCWLSYPTEGRIAAYRENGIRVARRGDELYLHHMDIDLARDLDKKLEPWPPKASLVNISDADMATIRQIVGRAFDECLISRRGKLDLEMDLCATHRTVPLRLADLLAADRFNFTHDVEGIRRHMNRSTGELEPTFCPRFAAPVAK